MITPSHGVGEVRMIQNREARNEIAEALGSSIDQLVQERMKGLVEEPDITSRIGQRLEDRFDGKHLSGYKIKVITETITSHGAGSLEHPMGTDLYFGVSIEDAKGNETSKGIFVQAKRKDKVKWPDLREQCRRMNLVTKKGSVIFIYKESGIDVVRSDEGINASSNVLSSAGFFDAVLECWIGDKRKAPRGNFGDRSKLKRMLQTLGAENAVWLSLEKI